MADQTIDDIIRDQREAIVAAVQERMRGDEAMSAVAAQRALTEGDLSAQVLGFWLQGIGSDLTLGSTTTMAQNLQWLVSLRRGHDLPFENEMVGACSTRSPWRSARGSGPTPCAKSTRRTRPKSRASSPPPSPSDRRHAVTLEDYMERLLAGDEAACLAEAQARAEDLDGLHRLYVDLIAPSQYGVGELWESGAISVATEHLATAVNTFVAGACYAPLARRTTGGPRAMVACTPEEMHELGARLLADLLECDGWDVDFYGTSMPVRDLILAIRERRPRFVALSAALGMHLGSVKRTIASIREDLGPETPPIVVGGNAFRSDPHLWEMVGADLYAADASEAVAMLKSLQH